MPLKLDETVVATHQRIFILPSSIRRRIPRPTSCSKVPQSGHRRVHGNATSSRTIVCALGNNLTRDASNRLKRCLNPPPQNRYSFPANSVHDWDLKRVWWFYPKGCASRRGRSDPPRKCPRICSYPPLLLIWGRPKHLHPRPFCLMTSRQ